MTLIIATIASICSKWNITPEHFDKATYCSTKGQGFYIVESQTTVGVEYHVKYNAQYNALSCTCKASDNGRGCWHRRAAMAGQEHYKATEQARRQQEQATIEATVEYQIEQAFRDLEDALNQLDRIAEESDRRAALHSV